MSKIYIHYGSDRFRLKQFRPIINMAHRNKPDGGLWASAVDAEYGWKQWNEDTNRVECRDECAFRFTLADDANVYRINSVDDVRMMPRQGDFMHLDGDRVIPDFYGMKSAGVDVIEFNLSNDWHLYDALYGWDCDCILVLNPDVVKEIKN